LDLRFDPNGDQPAVKLLCSALSRSPRTSRAASGKQWAARSLTTTNCSRKHSRRPTTKARELGVDCVKGATEADQGNLVTYGKELMQSIRKLLTRLGEMAAHPSAFGVLVLYALLWFIFDRDTLDWHPLRR
jgi:hypothetical protein